jgi:hypothetical protein
VDNSRKLLGEREGEKGREVLPLVARKEVRPAPQAKNGFRWLAKSRFPYHPLSWVPASHWAEAVTRCWGLPHTKYAVYTQKVLLEEGKECQRLEFSHGQQEMAQDPKLRLQFHLFFFLWYWGLSLGLRTCKAGTLPLESPSSVHFARLFFEMGASRTLDMDDLHFKFVPREGLTDAPPPCLQMWWFNPGQVFCSSSPQEDTRAFTGWPPVSSVCSVPPTLPPYLLIFQFNFQTPIF